jgi:hypothetical protein
MPLLLTRNNRPDMQPSASKPRLIKNARYPDSTHWTCACYVIPSREEVFRMNGRCGVGKTAREAYQNWKNRNERSIKL